MANINPRTAKLFAYYDRSALVKCFAMGGLTSKKKREESGTQEQPSLLDQLSDGTVVILTSKASGKSLRIHENTVDVSRNAFHRICIVCS